MLARSTWGGSTPHSTAPLTDPMQGGARSMCAAGACCGARDPDPAPRSAGSLVAGLALLGRGSVVAPGARGTRAAASVQLQLDELPADPGALQRRPGLRGQLR